MRASHAASFRLTRRSVLRMLAAAAALSAGCAGEEKTASPDFAGPDCAPTSGSATLRVVVVGAGMAGLTAARALTACGISVTVLEARDRLGGRLWTDDSQGVPLDLGASWIHGVGGNPLTALAAQAGLQTIPSDVETVQLWDANGQPVTESALDKAADKAKAIAQAIETDAESRDDDISWGAAIDARDDTDDPVLRWILRSDLAVEYNADLDALSVWHGTDDNTFDGEDHLFAQGYGALAEWLARDLDVRKAQAVTRIERSSEGVTVWANEVAFEADAVICTVPLGVLRAGRIAMEPALPTPVTAAIDGLRMGVLNKLYLRFDKAFWPTDAGILGRISPNTGTFQEFFNLSAALGAPILLAFNAGATAIALEALPRDALVSQAMAALRELFPDAPDPLGAVETRWSGDPWAGGSYSYVPTGTSSTAYETLAKPIDDRLFLAGEATIRTYRGTVHGAHLSGLRAASQVWDLLADAAGG